MVKFQNVHNLVKFHGCLNYLGNPWNGNYDQILFITNRAVPATYITRPLNNVFLVVLKKSLGKPMSNPGLLMSINMP